MMDDPFAEFTQVSEASSVAAVDSSTSSLLAHVDNPSHAIQATPDFECIRSSFAPDFQQTAEEHFNQRRKYEQLVNQKVEEINAAMNRLYVVRFDASLSPEDVLRETKGLLGRLNVLNEELAQVREKQMFKFTSQLLLDDIGLSRRMRSKSFRTASQVDVEEKRVPTKSDNNLLQVGGSGFSRTSSANALRSQPKTDDSWNLFRVFHRTPTAGSVTLPQFKTCKEVNDLVTEEIASIRANIYQINQRKKLTDADRNLLRVLQAKLKALQECV